MFNYLLLLVTYELIDVNFECMVLFQTFRDDSNLECLVPDIDISDPSKWPPILTDKLRNFIISNPLPRPNLNHIDFSKSERQYEPNIRRRMTSSMFFAQLPNGESVCRDWLQYSEVTGKCYCVPCSLFYSTDAVIKLSNHSTVTLSSSSKLCTTGFNDWKHSNFAPRTQTFTSASKMCCFIGNCIDSEGATIIFS